MKRLDSRGVALVDVVACAAFVLVAAGIAAPALSRLRVASKTTRCQENLKHFVTTSKIYANDNGELWPIPPSSQSAYAPDGNGIDYLADSRNYDMPVEPGDVGYDRETETTSDDAYFETIGSSSASTTRALWMLVRSGDMYPEDFICPSSRDVAIYEYDVDAYYDFATYRNVSYGYQVPFGPRGARPTEGADPRNVYIADKGPFYLDTFEPTFETLRGEPLTPASPRWRWRRYNSPNHWGTGQNVGYADGSVTFAQTPLAGVQGDNIYSLMTDAWDDAPFNWIHGESPHYATVGPNPFPGEGAFGLEPSTYYYSSTDSLIYP